MISTDSINEKNKMLAYLKQIFLDKLRLEP